MLASYARVREYIDGLPNGIESHPECKVRADVFTLHRQKLSAHVKHEGLPEQLRAAIAGSPGLWISDVVGTCMPLLLRDAVFKSDEALMTFTHEAAMQLFKNPLYRVMMRVLSPMLILSGTSRRWGTFRTGSTLTAYPVEKRADRHVVRVSLAHPPRLYPRLMLETFGAAFRASVELSGARETRSALTKSTDTLADFELSWRA